MIQQDLFNPVKLKHAYLVSESPRKAFYRLWIDVYQGEYCVRKESGGKNKVLDRRSWCFSSQKEAEKLFNRRIREKTKPDRKSPRKYRLVSD